MRRVEKLYLYFGAAALGILMGTTTSMTMHAIAKAEVYNVAEPMMTVLESQQEILEHAVAAIPDPCGLIDVVCPDEASPTVQEKIESAAAKYGVDPVTAVAIAGCESSMNPYAESDRSTAKGLYQFTDRTWRYIKADGHQFDVDENIRQFMIWYPVHPEWWECE